MSQTKKSASKETSFRKVCPDCNGLGYVVSSLPTLLIPQATVAVCLRCGGQGYLSGQKRENAMRE